MIVDSALYRHGKRVDVGCQAHEYEKLRSEVRDEGDFVWVGLYSPSEGELEDALKAHQRPKLDRYEDSLFLTLKTLWYVDEEDAVETGEINMFLGRDFVVTVRHGSGSQLQSARAFLESTEGVLTHGPSAVLYAVCDTVVDGYLAVVEELQVDVDQVEESVFSPARTNDSVRIYTLKREISEVRRAVFPLRDPVRRFAEGLIPGIDKGAGPFFRDVLDHLHSAAESVDGLDSLLSTAFDAHLARISVQQNDDMRKISAGAALVVVPTLIAGVYGMNFEHMPELSWTYGYPMALAFMVLVSAGLWILFKKSGWL